MEKEHIRTGSFCMESEMQVMTSAHCKRFNPITLKEKAVSDLTCESRYALVRSAGSATVLVIFAMDENV